MQLGHATQLLASQRSPLSPLQLCANVILCKFTIFYLVCLSSQAMETQAQQLSAVQATTVLAVSTPLRPLSTPAGLATSAPWAAPFLNAAPTAPSSSTQMHTTATCAPLAITVTPTQVSAVVFSGLALF